MVNAIITFNIVYSSWSLTLIFFSSILYIITLREFVDSKLWFAIEYYFLNNSLVW